MPETEDNPYDPPKEIEAGVNAERSPGWWVARIGIILYCGPIIGERIGHFRIVGQMKKLARDYGSSDEFHERFFELSLRLAEENSTQ